MKKIKPDSTLAGRPFGAESIYCCCCLMSLKCPTYTQAFVHVHCHIPRDTSPAPPSRDLWPTPSGRIVGEVVLK